MSYLHCPRCRLAIRCRGYHLNMTHCPRCEARAGIPTTLFASPLNAYELRAAGPDMAVSADAALRPPAHETPSVSARP
jgi:hypothetical protein